MTDLNIHEIYESLVAGNRLRMTFETKGAAEGFRSRLHSVRTHKESQLQSIGLIEQSEKQTLRCTIENVDTIFWAEFWFEARKELRKYEILIVPIIEQG